MIVCDFIIVFCLRGVPLLCCDLSFENVAHSNLLLSHSYRLCLTLFLGHHWNLVVRNFFRITGYTLALSVCQNIIVTFVFGGIETLIQ